MDRNDLAYWFPILAGTGVPVPRTQYLRTDVELGPLLNGEIPDGWGDFLRQLDAAAGMVGGYPVFLRTGHGSGKHEWESTCYVQSPGVMGRHVAALVEWSECVDMIGLPYRTWAVREFLSLEAPFRAAGYRGMPVNRERRYFVEGGRVLCSHPYWPTEAVERGRPSDPDWRVKLAALNQQPPGEVALLTGLSERVSRAFDGAWSLDWAKATDGTWYAIDMAEAVRSWHWPGCAAAADLMLAR